MTTLTLLIGCGFAVWFWQDSLRAKEFARASCIRACRRNGMQLLDDTVALDKVWPRRKSSGRLALERRYTFEFTNDGRQRNRGIIVLLGTDVELLALDGDDLLIL